MDLNRHRYHLRIWVYDNIRFIWTISSSANCESTHRKTLNSASYIRKFVQRLLLSYRHKYICFTYPDMAQSVIYLWILYALCTHIHRKCSIDAQAELQKASCIPPFPLNILSKVTFMFIVYSTF